MALIYESFLNKLIFLGGLFIMKRFALVFALVLVLAISAGAEDFGKFTADVPAGWTATQNGPTTIFTKNDNTSNLSITVDETGGATLEQLADAFVDAFKNSGNFTDFTKPEKGEDGSITFDMKTTNGVVSNCMITSEDGKYLLVVVTGAENGGEDLVNIMNSIKEK